jgi:hypothetical protein
MRTPRRAFAHVPSSSSSSSSSSSTGPAFLLFPPEANERRGGEVYVGGKRKGRTRRPSQDEKRHIHSFLSIFDFRENEKKKTRPRFVTTTCPFGPALLASTLRLSLSYSFAALRLCSLGFPLPRARHLTLLVIISSKLNRIEPNRIELN